MRGFIWGAIAVAALVASFAFGVRLFLTTLHRLDGSGQVAAPAVPCAVTGRVHDGEGLGLPGASLTFVDTTGTVGHHILAHPRTLTIAADDAGVFSASLPFTPNRATVSGGHDYRKLDWVEVRPPDAGAMEFVLPKIRWANLEAHVTDETGAPLDEVHVEPGRHLTNDAGWVQFELLPEAVPATFRVRKMGFKPVNVEPSQLSNVVLRERRTLVRVSLVSGSTKTPLAGRRKVTALHGDELVSFCTTDETTGSCTLDADPGTEDLELRVGKRAVTSVAVGSSPLEVVLSVDE